MTLLVKLANFRGIGTRTYLFDGVFQVLDGAPGLIYTLPHCLRGVRLSQS